MELTVETLLRSISLLDGERLKCVLTNHGRALDLACREKLISPELTKEYRVLKRRVFNDREQTTMTENNSSETATRLERGIKEAVKKSEEESEKMFQNFVEKGPLDEYELQCLFDQNDLIKRNRWSKWVLMFFLIVPKGKYISRQYINEVLESWGYNEKKRLGAEDRYVRQSTLMSKLSALVREGFLEKENLFDEKYKGGEGLPHLIAFCEESIHGIVKIHDSRTQSVFRLTEKGVKHALHLRRSFSVCYRPKDSKPVFFKEFGILPLGPGACPSIETFLADSYSYHKSGLIFPGAGDLIHRIKPTKRSTVLKLVSVNENDLSLDASTDYQVFFRRAIELGLQLCPDDTALALFYHQYEGIKEESVRIITSDLESCFVLWRTRSGTVRLAAENLDDLNYAINLNQFLFAVPLYPL